MGILQRLQNLLGACKLLDGATCLLMPKHHI